MKRRRIVGLGAIAAGVAAFFLQPRRGAERREAVRRGGELVRQGAAATLVGKPHRRGRREDSELRVQVEDALVSALGVAGDALSVSAHERTVTVRGEVAFLEQISRVSQVLDSFQGRAEVVNLVRLRTPEGAGRRQPAG